MPQLQNHTGRGSSRVDGGAGPGPRRRRTVAVAGDGALAQDVRLRVARVVQDQLGVALAVGVDHRADDAQAGALRVEVFAVARLRAGWR